MKRNLERERLIRYYWDLGYTIARIHEVTGIPMSTIGYYTRKFGPRKKAAVSSGSSSVMANTQPVNELERVLFQIPRPENNTNALEMAIRNADRVIISRRREEWSKRVDKLMSKGDYRSVKDLCGAIFFMYQDDKIFNRAINGSEVWSNELFKILSDFFDYLT